MKLREYLKAKELSESEFADRIGVSQAAVNRYCNGRVPRQKIMDLIIAKTKGQVTANDWFAKPAE